MVIKSELKLHDTWNDSLSDPNSQSYAQLKEQLEAAMNITFCTNQISIYTCHVKITGFTEGSINVLFEIIKTEPAGGLPTVAEILASMNEAIASGGIAGFAVDESSVKISKILCFFANISHSSLSKAKLPFFLSCALSLAYCVDIICESLRAFIIFID